ncbi:POTRA domain-containing protein [Neisseria lisongii]
MIGTAGIIFGSSNGLPLWATVIKCATAAQNVIIGRGYTTTRILAAPQDLNSG